MGDMPAPTTSLPTALVTGASGGIGAEFARRLAPDHDVVIVARSGDRLEQVRAELVATRASGSFTAVVADLSTPDGVETVLAAVGDRAIDVLVNNAGVGSHGAFVESDLAAVQAQVHLNCSQVVALTRALLPGMVERRRGTVVNVASTAAFQPIPTMAVYGATKSFVLSFSEAVHAEVRGSGVTVTALCPGATETGFFAATGSDFLTSGRQTPEQVVTAALRAVRRRRAVVVSGLGNAIGAQAHRFLPRRLVTAASALIVRER
jgi:short-subunit dehydrogenase